MGCPIQVLEAEFTVQGTPVFPLEELKARASICFKALILFLAHLFRNLTKTTAVPL